MKPQTLSAAVALFIATTLWLTPEAIAQDKTRQQPPNKLESAKPWLGIGIEKGKSGVKVTRVLPGTPAEQHGFAVGDEVLQIDKQKVRDPSELIKAVTSSGVGVTVEVRLLRKGKVSTKSVTLVARPGPVEMLRKNLVGNAFPDKDLADLNGKAWSLDRVKGKVVFVEFWATWCPACRATHNRLSQWAKSQSKVEVIAISGEDPATIAQYMKTNKSLAFTSLHDVKQRTSDAMWVTSLPTLLVLDSEHKVSHVNIGAGIYLEQAIGAAEMLIRKSQQKSK